MHSRVGHRLYKSGRDKTATSGPSTENFLQDFPDLNGGVGLPFLAAESSSLAKISMSAECKYSLATSAIHRESGTLTSIDFGCLQSGLESDLFYNWLHANFFGALLRFHFRLGLGLCLAFLFTTEL